MAEPSKSGSRGRILPRYPVYVISKGRWDIPACSSTARCLMQDRVPFRLVVEPPEAEAYGWRFGAEKLLVLPFHDLGQGSIPARNWVWEHAARAGHERHWILDDNIRDFRYRSHGVRVVCNAGNALRATEDFTERYEDVAI